jgi:8-oxo-dGTP pyrophosphatase MutT (NUDIX family)
MKPGIVRPIAICVFHRDGRILAAEYEDPVRGITFYRPLGGTIEFGEYSATTIEREMAEELGAGVTNLRFLGALENVFTHKGLAGHEIVLVYDGELADVSLYKREALEGVEDSGAPLRAVWVRLDDCRIPGAPPLYPTGLLELLDAMTLEATA